MSELQDKINKRRTFAIISHPDAGKTTLTENCFFMGAPSILPDRSRAAKQIVTPFLTGWKLKTERDFCYKQRAPI